MESGPAGETCHEGMAAAASPPAASPQPPPEVDDARGRLVKALHGALLQSHVNAPRAQATAVDALLTMVQARPRRTRTKRGP